MQRHPPARSDVIISVLETAGLIWTDHWPDNGKSLAVVLSQTSKTLCECSVALLIKTGFQLITTSNVTFISEVAFLKKMGVFIQIMSTHRLKFGRDYRGGELLVVLNRIHIFSVSEFAQKRQNKNFSDCYVWFSRKLAPKPLHSPSQELTVKKRCHAHVNDSVTTITAVYTITCHWATHSPPDSLVGKLPHPIELLLHASRLPCRASLLLTQKLPSVRKTFIQARIATTQQEQKKKLRYVAAIAPRRDF